MTKLHDTLNHHSQPQYRIARKQHDVKVWSVVLGLNQRAHSLKGTLELRPHSYDRQ